MTATLQNRITAQSTGQFVSLGYVVLGSFNEQQIEEWVSSNNIDDKVTKHKIDKQACNNKPCFEIKVQRSVLADKTIPRPPQLPAC